VSWPKRVALPGAKAPVYRRKAVRRPRTERCRCEGGPWGGEFVRLTPGQPSTMPIRVRGWVGRYVFDRTEVATSGGPGTGRRQRRWDVHYVRWADERY
jgi:hypothetical protein